MPKDQPGGPPPAPPVVSSGGPPPLHPAPTTGLEATRATANDETWRRTPGHNFGGPPVIDELEQRLTRSQSLPRESQLDVWK